MISTDRLIFLQLQKSGCTHVEKILLECYHGVQHHKHMPLIDRRGIGNRLVISSIRNPWHFYLSLWSFSCMKMGGSYDRPTSEISQLHPISEERLKWVPFGRRAAVVTSHHLAEAKREPEFYKQVFRDASAPHAFRLWLRRVLGGKHKFDLFPDYGYARIKCGLLTYLHLLLALRNPQKLFYKLGDESYPRIRQLYEEEFGLARVIRTERLADDLIEALRLAGHEVSSSTEERIRNGEKTNTSSRMISLQDAYDAGCIALVDEADRLIIEQFGYQFSA